MNNTSKNKVIIFLFLGFFSVLLIFCLSQFRQKETVNSNDNKITEPPVHEVTAVIQKDSDAANEPVTVEVSYSDLPQYSGEQSIPLNDDIPSFTEEELHSLTGVQYSELDELGRCSEAYGLIGPETIPDSEREPIGDVKPSGWHTVRYDDLIEDRYLYNRCHLIGYQLAGTNAEPRNLITGTRYLNITGMLPYENKVWEYVTGTGNHVLYRATPVFESDNLIASGVILEAYSIEDEGKGVQFCRYLFNVQPGVVIDYKTGDSRIDNSYEVPVLESEPLVLIETESNHGTISRQIPVAESTDDDEITYVLNTNTMRFHDPSCPSVEEMKEKNRAYSTDSREELIELGYKPCGRCNP